MLSKDVVEGLSKELDEAEQTATQIRQLSLRYPEMTVQDAYAVQRAWVAMKVQSGRLPIGRKIGLTSKAMQRSSNITEPDFGVLLDDMQFADGAIIATSKFIVPRVEVELAFILKSPLHGPTCSIFDVLSATDYVVPALEIIDARIQQVDPESKTTRKVFDTISDNAANAAIVLGGRPVKPMKVDLRWIAAILYRNGVVEESGVAAAVLNHPANGPSWLANKLHPYGEFLKPGEIILGGSFTAPVPARPGDVFHVDYGPLGAVTCSFI